MGRRKQGGWVGMVALLIALLIVAWLAKDALKKYGLVDARPQMPATATSVESVSPGAATAVDRVRALESTMKQESEKRDRGY